MENNKTEKELNLQKEYENLKIKADFLSNRLDELRDENFRLHSVISSLKDEIQVFNSSI